MWLVADEINSVYAKDEHDFILTPVQQRHLARLLVGNGKHILQTPIAITQLITAALLRLDALLANLFATTLNNPVVQRTCSAVVGRTVMNHLHFLRGIARTESIAVTLEIILVIVVVPRGTSTVSAPCCHDGAGSRGRWVAQVGSLDETRSIARLGGARRSV